MTKPFNKPTESEKRLKMLIFGKAGAGKTRFSLNFPSPSVVDTEKGTVHYGKEFDFEVIHTSNPDDIMETVNWLLTNKHDYKTFIFDSFTVYYSALQDKYADIFLTREKKSAGFKFEYYKFQPNDYPIVKRGYHKLMRMIDRLDMNVICITHEKDEYADGGFMQKTGDKTFDGEKSLEHYFDTVVHLQKTKDGKYLATQKKDRTGKLPDKTFEINYEIFAKAFGEESLNKESTPIALATELQVVTLQNYTATLKLKPEMVRQALAKYGVESWGELKEEIAEEIISKFNKMHQNQNQESR